MPYGQAATPARPGQQRNVYSQPVMDSAGAPLPAKPRTNGVWDASIAIEGIDAHHTFATERRLTAPFGPDSMTDNQPSIGGYDYEKSVAGPYNLLYDGNQRDQKEYWQDRQGEKVRAYQFEQYAPPDMVSGTGDITRPRDPREFSIPTDDRPTLHQGPDMASMVRTGPWLFGRFRESRFNGSHASYAFTPSLRPSPMQYGTGVGGKRFRPTQRQTPDPMVSQYTTAEVQGQATDIFASGSMPQYW